MRPEDAVAYVETLCRRHGLGVPDNGPEVMKALADEPHIIRRFIHEAELSIERAAERKEAAE
jgi:hypothetical protein